jgi:penicillin-binding protein 1A
MGHEGYLSDGQVQEFKQKPLGLDFHPINHTEGIAPYFRHVLKSDKKNIQTQNKADGTPYDIDRDGLKYTLPLMPPCSNTPRKRNASICAICRPSLMINGKAVSCTKVIKNFKLLIDQGMHQSDRYKQLNQPRGK